MTTETVELETENNRLQVSPELGGGITAWDWKTTQGWTPMLRAWDRKTSDRYTLACFALVPWSNRITGGGFEHEGAFHPIKPNREGEPYPIHGDGWLQRWHVAKHDKDTLMLALESHCFDGNPYEYSATQTFTLLPDGLEIDLSVKHLGNHSLPYGLGLHPYFPCNDATRLRSKATGVWLSGKDEIPVEHTENLPPTYDYNQPAALAGPLIDNCFTGWDGKAEIDYPDRGLKLTMTMENSPGYSLMYRPPEYDYFCLEPITHPIDAFHMPGQPGLVNLSKGQTFSLKTRFIIS